MTVTELTGTRFTCPLATLSAAGPVPNPHWPPLEPMEAAARLPSLINELDLHLFGEGRHYQLYEHLGAHRRTVNGATGVNFAVWAPCARQISVIGPFNGWTGRGAVMERQESSGIWELFVPGIGPGELYKLRVVNFHGRQVDKCDPFGFAAEVPPRTANVVVDLDQHAWQDSAWMEQRAKSDPVHRPMSIYEVHLGSWQQRANETNGWMNYRDLAHELVQYCQKLGFTHIELLPVSEHPYTGSWGYQTTGYFAATSRYGQPHELMYLIDHCHAHGIGVLIDWVPAHFPKDAHGLARFDGTALYEHADPRQGEHPDWNTLIFNYGRNEVRNFLVANGLFWFDKYHIDGLRVDAVASMLYLDYSRKEGQWVPNRHGGRENLDAVAFFREFNEQAHQRFPGVLTIAEESTAWPGVSQPVSSGGLGFDFKWNMGWMNDTLRYMRNDPVHRQFHHDEITFSMVYAYSEKFLLPLSHDEVVHGKGSLIDQMPGDLWQKFANLRLLYSYMWLHPGKKLLFMGGEFAQFREWNCDQSLEWQLLEHAHHRGVQQLVGDLNRLYTGEPALHELDHSQAGFEWIDCNSRASSTLSWLRRDAQGGFLVVVCNFTPVVHKACRVGVPQPGLYREVFNSDSRFYDGSNVGNPLVAVSEPVPHHGHEQSIVITLPPLAAVVLKIREPGLESERKKPVELALPE